MISAHSVGNLLTGLIAGLLPLAIGLKKSLMWLNVLPFVGFGITLATGNPMLLIFALLLTGIGRGAVSNYNNQAVSALSGGSAAPLNMLHGFFAIGAVLAPFLTLVFTGNDNSGWRKAVYVVIALGVISIFTSSFMKMDSIPYDRPRKGEDSFAFLRDRQFVLSMVIMFFYLCVEASVMGWMVTYYTDSGVVTAESAQILNSVLWVIILIGRFACSALAGRLSPQHIIFGLCTGIVVFLGVLLMNSQLVPMLVGTIGLGFSLSGMYGTTVANAGDVFGKYPLAMGVFITITNIGSVITPSIIGSIAQHSNIRVGMGVLLGPAVIALVLAIVNLRKKEIWCKGILQQTRI